MRLYVWDAGISLANFEEDIQAIADAKLFNGVYHRAQQVDQWGYDGVVILSEVCVCLQPTQHQCRRYSFM